MAARLEQIAREVDCDADVRAVVIRGVGERASCAGSDINALADYKSAWHFRNRIEYATVIRDIRKPVVAALHG